MEFTERYEGVEDRTGWGPGPWDGEPDKVVWIDPETGLDCMARRGGGGSWCGYVGVKAAHPWHGKGYSTCLADPCDNEFCYEHSPESIIDVHGGLTFSGACHDDGNPESDICHISPEPVWWFGFDCAHAHDLRPREMVYRNMVGSTWPEPPAGYEEIYKPLPYVVAETTRLAEQIAAVQ